MRISILNFAEAEEILNFCGEDTVSVQEFKNKLINPLHHIFLDSTESILFCMFFVGMGLYDMHIYSKKHNRLSYLRDFCISCAREVSYIDNEMVGAINIVRKENRALRLMMPALFKSEKIKTFDNGDIMFFTDVIVTKGGMQ